VATHDSAPSPTRLLHATLCIRALHARVRGHACRYRAPEVLLRAAHYSAPIDLFALGESVKQHNIMGVCACVWL
jgi:hypothetical protein